MKSAFENKFHASIVGTVCLLTGLIFLKNAWLADDAFILFRSIDQWYAGNGPNWNSFERVQVYTSPLWYGVLALFHSIYADHAGATFFVSGVFFVGGLFVATRASEFLLPWLLLVVICVSADSILDFSSSGLETPLIFLLLALWFVLGKNLKRTGKAAADNRWLIVSALVILTRHDLILIILPGLAWYFFQQWQQHGRRQFYHSLMILAVLPVLWTIFSVFYYGFPFPNTAYAKLGAGVDRLVLVKQGLHYVYATAVNDPLSLGLVLTYLAVACIKRTPFGVVVAGGIATFALYVVVVGGDFMQGRFWAPIAWLSALGLCAEVSQVELSRARYAVCFSCLLIYSLVFHNQMSLYDPLSSGHQGPQADFDKLYHGIADERAFYARHTSLHAWLNQDGQTPFPQHDFCLQGRSMGVSRPGQTLYLDSIGMYAYCGGVELRIIDMYGLASPLLARLNRAPDSVFRIGHYRRPQPGGYGATVASGDNRIVDPSLRDYYHTLHAVVSSPDYLSLERWRGIWSLNVGSLKPPADFASEAD